VRCEPSLRQRVAFLSLRPRTWEETRYLLEYGLDLRIRPAVDTNASRAVWILERDRKVLSQEQFMRKQLADWLARYFAGKTASPPRQLNMFEIFRSLPHTITDTDSTRPVPSSKGTSRSSLSGTGAWRLGRGFWHSG
jgi:hypothetical protein